MARLWCRLFGHKIERTDIGHGTGVQINHCRRCPYSWSIS